MTTTVLPGQPDAPGLDPLRLVPIFANLLPPEIVDGRRARRARRLVLVGLALLVVAIGGWYGIVTYQTSTADTALVAAEDDALRLTQQQRAYAGVVQTQAESDAIRAQLATLLADDLQWSALLSALRAAAPAGIALTTVSGEVTEPTEGDPAATAEQLPSTATEKSIGTITVAGTGATKEQVAAFVDALATVPGVANPYLGGATAQDDRVQFTVGLDITAAVLGGRYTSPTPQGSAAPTGAPTADGGN